jgi:small-conductance mechanosensitive channel
MGANPTVLSLFRPAGIPYALLILVLTIVVVHVLNGFVEGLGRRFTDKRLVLSQIGSIARFGIYLLGFVAAALAVFHLTPEVALAVGGTAAVSLGFALKDLVDRPFQVGDRVTFDAWYGEITHIGLRSVRLLTLDDTQVTIPNNKFLTDLVASGNAGAVEMMIQMDFFIGLDQDLARAKQIVTESLTSSRYFSTARRWSVTVSEVAQDSYLALRLRAKAYVLDVRFEKAFETDVTERVIEGFRASGIEPPVVLHRSR